jgi:hypothetical protein
MAPSSSEFVEHVADLTLAEHACRTEFHRFGKLVACLLLDFYEDGRFWLIRQLPIRKPADPAFRAYTAEIATKSLNFLVLTEMSVIETTET